MAIFNLKDFFQRQNWTFARTYAAYAPHEYIVREKINGTDEEFVKAVETIRQYGIKMFYYKTPRRYLFVGGYFYWTMGSPIEETVIINRCRPSDYDIVFMKKGTQER